MLLLLFLALDAVYTGGAVDTADVYSALRTMEGDPATNWSIAFGMRRFCLVDQHPYTMRVELEKGETTRYVECQRPWRQMNWLCDEVERGCKLAVSEMPRRL